MAKQPAHPAARRRHYLIPKEHKCAANRLYWALEYRPTGSAHADSFKITLEGNAEQAIRNRITRMCRLAGVERTASPRADFETAIKTARRRAAEEGFDPEPVYSHARNIGERLEWAERDGRGAKPATRAARAATLKQVEIPAGCARFVDFGVLPGDLLTVAPLEGDPERGETVVMQWAGEGEAETDLGAFIKYEEDTKQGWGRCPRFEESDGQTHYYDPAGWAFYRILSVERGPGAPRPDTAKIRERVKELRAKLENLDESDYPREGERFRMEAEIGRLERQLSADEAEAEDADEWPDVIGEKGGE